MQGCLAVEGAPGPLLSSLFHFVAAQTYHKVLDEAEAAGHSLEDLHSASNCAGCGISEPARFALSQALQRNVHHQSPILELPPHVLRTVHAALTSIAAWALSEDHPQLAGFRLYPPLPGSCSDVASFTYMDEVWPVTWMHQPLLRVRLIAATAASLLCRSTAPMHPCTDLQPAANDAAHRLQACQSSCTPPAHV